MIVFNGDLIAAGSFTSIGGVFTTGGVARWNGKTWSPFGSQPISRMLVHEGELYAAGSFGDTSHVRRWDGKSQTWLPVGAFQPNVAITVITVFNGQLVAAGIGGVGVNASVWRFDGAQWQPIGQHLGFATVQALAVYNGELIAGGYSSPGMPNGGVRFNGTSWVTLGGGLYLSNDITADTLAVFDLLVHNGDLIVAGSFGHAGEQQYVPGSVTANHLARWDGSAWHAFGTGLNDASVCLHAHQGQIHVGGWFDTAGGRPAAHWARWGIDRDCAADVNCDAAVNSQDFFDFLSAFFANDLDADFNADGAINSPDFFDFLAAFFAGC
ncbi:MAG: hypothetical protein H7210_00300 [Pyrinomonadaceae bacterium]|nr:hypothetical protein [Phycisphaerales bacterium]